MSAAVFDVPTGSTYLLTTNASAQQVEASIVKVDILATLLAAHPGGLPASIQSLAQPMIEESDNDAATALWNQADAPAGIETFNNEIGLESTKLSDCVVCAGFPWPGWGLSATIASDQVSLLKSLVLPNPAITDPNRQYALGLMEHVVPSEDWGLTAGVPPGVTVALKNGWLPLQGSSDWQINSIGWISGQGRDYIAAVLVAGNPTIQYGIDTISQVSEALWSTLGH